MYTYNAKVVRVIDGDTFVADVDLGFRVSMNETFRLADIDTPETHRPKSDGERDHGEEAKQFVIDAIDQKEVIIVTSKTGKYGRWIARVLYNGPDEPDHSYRDLTEELIKGGFEKREYIDGFYPSE